VKLDLICKEDDEKETMRRDWGGMGQVS